MGRAWIRFLLLATLVAVRPASAQAQVQVQARHDQRLQTLQPGAFVVQQQTIPVEVVLVGYDRRQVDEGALLRQLPRTYTPVVRYPQAYGLNGRSLGLEYQFRYRVRYTSRAFEDDFFAFLSKTGTEGPPTIFQDAYNAQARNVLDVEGPVLYVDGPAVESYLAAKLGDRRGYTIVFINWYGRSDFRFHVYTKTDDPDPDTGYDFGTLRGSRKMIAWGGSASRTWFYDLSAGPESWTNNWIVDDDQQEYHMPPVWEYRVGGYRPASQLSVDLGLVARFVGIDLLFTTSPLYDPLVTAPDTGGGKVVHISMQEDDPASIGADFVDPRRTRLELRRFQPYYPWRVGLSDHRPIDPEAKRSFDIFADTLVADDCWNAYGSTFAQLYCYFSEQLARYVPSYGPRDYVGEIFAFNTTDEAMGSRAGLLGYADDNWIDGTQTHVFMFDTPALRDAGFGFTATGIHEFGHHIGLSHPHDGWDSELGLDFGPSGPFEFAWSGDESHTVMHYIALSNSFGTFDRDNQYRWETAGYLNWANAILGDLQDHPRRNEVSALLREADALAGAALVSFRKWEYLEAVHDARRTYDLVATAARRIGAGTPALDAARRALPGVVPRRIVCEVRHPWD